MKVGGGLNFVSGPMGSGKSLYAVRNGVRTLCNGQYWVTNVELRDDAFDRIARHVCKAGTRTKKRKIADKLRRYYIYETDLSEARNYRFPGKGEGRARFSWDEGHNNLNNRKWKDDGRAELLEWATQLRKLGLLGELLTQHADNTDAALRRVCNFHVRLQNQREQTRLLGLRVSPWPLFLAYWYPAHLGLTGQRIKPMRTERYFLGWHRHLYDTHALYHGLVFDGDADGLIWLPPTGREMPGSPAGGSGIVLAGVKIA